MNACWITPKSQYLRPNLLFSSDDLPLKYHYSIENLCLHITQVLSQLTEVYERNQQRISAGKPQELTILDETLSFRQMTYAENITIS